MADDKQEKLTPKQRRFAELYVRLGNAAEAARQAGYSAKTAREMGRQNLTKLDIKNLISELSAAFHDEQRARLTALADDAINALHETILHGRGMPRVTAANSVLDRVGHKPADKIQAEITGKGGGPIQQTNLNQDEFREIAAQLTKDI